MRRAVERYLEDPFAEELLRGNVKAGDVVHVSADERQARLPCGRTARQRRPARAESAQLDDHADTFRLAR